MTKKLAGRPNYFDIAFIIAAVLSFKKQIPNTFHLLMKEHFPMHHLFSKVYEHLKSGLRAR